MVDEKTRFHSTGLTWAERAALGGLQAVLAPTGSGGGGNLFLHGIHSFGAAQALRYFPTDGPMIDFGCGNGRFARYFASRGRHVLGTEITPEMAVDAKKQCPSGGEFVVTDGVSIPVRDNSIGGIWCCGVLRYSLFVENPCYAEIATDMFRVLQPGGHVVNCEMWVDVPPTRFTEDFEQAGFRTRRVLVLNRYDGKPERWFGPRYIPEEWLQFSGGLCAWLRSRFDDPNRLRGGLRDYLFIWEKPSDAKR